MANEGTGHGHHNYLSIVAIVLQVISSGFLALRLYSRFSRKSGKAGTDDAFLVIGWVGYTISRKISQQSNRSIVVRNDPHCICNTRYELEPSPLLDIRLTKTGSLYWGYNRHIIDIPISDYSLAAFVSSVSIVVVS